jgi:hypothetical protein
MEDGMDKVVSARLDETVVDELNRATKRRGVTKKEFLEGAIRVYAAQDEGEAGMDVWAETCGTWRRREAPQATIRRARAAFNATMTRHHRRPPRRR